MNIDSHVWKKWCCEAGSIFKGSRISAIRQLDLHNYDIALLTENGVYYLHLCLLPIPSIWFSRHKRAGNELQPSPFCMVLRKHLEGAVCLDIDLINGDKIIRIRSSRIEMQAKIITKDLYFELLSGNGILILAEQNEIIDASRYENKGRKLNPKEKYSLPPHADRMDWLSFDEEELLTLLTSLPTNKPLKETLFAYFNGFSGAMWQELSNTISITSDLSLSDLTSQKISELITLLMNWKNELHNSKNKNVYVYTYAGKSWASPLSYYQIPIDCYKTFQTANELIEKTSMATTRQPLNRQNLKKKINTLIAHEKRKLKKIESEQKETAKMNKYKLYADLLAIYAYLPHRYENGIEVVNLLSEEQEKIKIPLLPEKNISANSQQYYKKYNRLKRRSEISESFRRQSKEKLEYLYSLQYFLENNDNPILLKETENEIKLLTGKTKKNIASKKENSKPYQDDECDGYRIGVGMNNTQNDYLTIKVAGPNDLWFHAKGVPGSHVIVFKDNHPDFTDQVVTYAAKLAAYYSKARDAGKVDVDYTHRKFIKKAKNSPPGLVYYTNQHTLSVIPQKVEKDGNL